MGVIFFTATNAVLPIILLILLGFFLKKGNLLTEDFLDTGNKLVFRVFLPVMLFINVYNIESVQALRWDVIGYCLAMVAVLFCIGLLTAVITTPIAARRGVLLQCTFRSNFAIIGLSLSAAMGGAEAESIAAVIAAFVVPLYNILAVIALSMFAPGSQKRSITKILKDIVKNPLIIGAFIGLASLMIRYLQDAIFHRTVFSLRQQMPFVLSALNQMKNCTTPLALVILGGQFRFSAAKEAKKEILIGSLWRVVLAPMIGVGTAILLSEYTNLLSFGPKEYPALVALFGTPTAVSSAVMARQMGGDGQLATQYVVWTSLASIVTIFSMVCLLMYLGFLAV